MRPSYVFVGIRHVHAVNSAAQVMTLGQSNATVFFEGSEDVVDSDAIHVTAKACIRLFHDTAAHAQRAGTEPPIVALMARGASLLRR